MSKERENQSIIKRIVNAPSVFNTHMASHGRPPEDDAHEPAVIWGKRVGKGLAVVAAIILVAYLVDYFFMS